MLSDEKKIILVIAVAVIAIGSVFLLQKKEKKQAPPSQDGKIVHMSYAGIAPVYASTTPPVISPHSAGVHPNPVSEILSPTFGTPASEISPGMTGFYQSSVDDLQYQV